MTDPRDRVVQAAREWRLNEWGTVTTDTIERNRTNDGFPDDVQLELIRAVDALPADMTSGDGWRPIEEAPVDTPVWLYCPHREPITNPERIEYGVAHTSTGLHHAWATLWQPAIKPLPPTPASKPEGDDD